MHQALLLNLLLPLTPTCSKTRIPIAKFIIAPALTVFACGCAIAQESGEYDTFRRYQQVTAEIAFLNRMMVTRRSADKKDESGPEGNSQDNSLSNRLRELKELQQELLDSLIATDPDKAEYQYELAKLVAGRGDRDRSMDILNRLAREDGTGLPQAYFVVAQYYFDLPATGMERTGNLIVAETQINHLLTRDPKNASAKSLKAKILFQLKSYEGAYRIYEEMLESNPSLYRQMANINLRLGREGNNTLLYERALKAYRKLLEREDVRNDNRSWILMQNGITQILQKLRRFEEAESHLDASMKSARTGSPRQEYLRRLFASMYLEWANAIAPQNSQYDTLPEATQQNLLELFAKAFEHYPENKLVLQNITRLSFSRSADIAKKARIIYDANSDVDAPAVVLNQLGNHELRNNRISRSIRYYEQAHEKLPDDPAILNNLAYAILAAPEDEQNPERALSLIEKGLSKLPADVSATERSKFTHTKASALKRLNRFEDAIKAYEESLSSRPTHRDSLESIIQCYEGLGKTPPDVYLSRLKQVGEN